MIRRLLAVGSAASIIAALGVAVSTAGAAASRTSISFTSTPATLTFTEHTTTPSATGPATAAGATTGGATNSGDTAADNGKPGVSALSPKGDVHRNNSHPGGGVLVNNSASGTSSSTPATSSSFAGQAASNVTCSYFAHGCNPPDMALAAGPNGVLQGVNTQFTLYNGTTGEPLWVASAQNFFGISNEPDSCDTTGGAATANSPFLSDPRALFDPSTHRYWASALQVEDALGIAPGCPFASLIWVGVSATSDPSGAWHVYAFDTTAPGQNGFATDYDHIGVNGQGFYGSANMFHENAQGNVDGFYAEVFEADKAKMEAGATDFAVHAFLNMQGTGPSTKRFGAFLADTVQPAMNEDSSAGADETFVDTIDGPDLNNGHFCGFAGGGFNQACEGLVVWRMHDPLGSPTFTATFIPAAPFLLAPAQTQPSCSQCVDSLDLRITGRPGIRNGVLYGSWDTAIQSSGQVVAGIEWAAVSLGSNTATTGYFCDNAGDTGSATFGTLMPDAQGNVTMVFDHMSSTTFPEIRYITKAAGAANFSGQGVLLQAGANDYRPAQCGAANFGVCRWGDYEATSFDGAGHIWFSSQFANTLNTGAPQFGRNWGTWIGAIAAS